MILDGAMGTLLEARGHRLPTPAWSAWAVEHAPGDVATAHREYVDAGADVVTACTFRTTPRALGPAWRPTLDRAVDLARQAGARHVAGSLAPLEDCWHPERSPADPRPEHRELCRALAAAGVDLILCETFAHGGEALVAVEEAVATGLPVWLSLTAGFDGTLCTPDAMRRTAQEAVARGAWAVLVNCVPADATLPYVRALADAGVRFGAYANAGHGDAVDPPFVYAAHAATRRAAGASMVGGCCGPTPRHIEALREAGSGSTLSK